MIYGSGSKSYQDGGAPLQMLGYMVRIWQKYVREGKDLVGRTARERALPPIIPVLGYTGTQPWRERFQYGKLDEKHAKMTHEEANWRLILTQPSGYSNSFSSGNEGKATRDDLHRKDWDGSSRRAGPTAVPPHLSPLLEVGHSWTRKVSHR